MKIDFQIRSADPAEASTLSALALRAKTHWGYPAEWLRQWATDLTLTPEYLSAHSAFVAITGRTQVGLCVLGIRDGKAALDHLWIAPEYHHCGVGRALVARALETAAAERATRVEVLSDPFAEAFYLKLGARRVRAVPAPMPGAPERTLPLLEFVLTLSRA